MGSSWEGMVVEEILRQLNVQGGGYQYAYYRTGAGGEVDLILEGDFGLVAMEVKHTSTVGGRDLRSLRDFTAEHKARLGVVINNDIWPRLYEDRIVRIPFTHL
jgi:predicted AAA+ superfamily ATPase